MPGARPPPRPGVLVQGGHAPAQPPVQHHPPQHHYLQAQPAARGGSPRQVIPQK